MAKQNNSTGPGTVLAFIAFAPAFWLFSHKQWAWLWAWIAVVAVVGVSILVFLFRADDRARLAQAERDRHLSTTDTQSGAQFERTVARLLIRDGWRDVRVLGGAGDHGCDILAISPCGSRLAVQCKRYGPSRAIPPHEVRDFGFSSRSLYNARLAVFITTSRYSKQSIQTARLGAITLVDRAVLGHWMASPAGWSLSKFGAKAPNGARVRR